MRPRRASNRRVAMLSIAAVAVLVAAPVTAFALLRGDASHDYQAALRGTALAPAAYASAAMSRSDAGYRITLDAHGLPALRGGEYYQAWLKNRGDQRIAIGTFSTGNGRVPLWSGVSPKDFPTITVTIQKPTDDARPSGRPVLSGVTRLR